MSTPTSAPTYRPYLTSDEVIILNALLHETPCEIPDALKLKFKRLLLGIEAGVRAPARIPAPSPKKQEAALLVDATQRYMDGLMTPEEAREFEKSLGLN